MDLKSAAKLGLNKHKMCKTEKIKGSDDVALNLELTHQECDQWGESMTALFQLL